jgi:copper chaperone CopZ
MKKVIFAIIAIVVFSCAPSTPNESVMEIKVEGMSCSHSCAPFIQKKLSNTEGVLDAKVTFENKTAIVKIDENNVQPEEVLNIINTIADGQYKVESFETKKLNTKKEQQSPAEPQSSKNFDITDPNVSSSGFQLPNLFSLLSSLIR